MKNAFWCALLLVMLPCSFVHSATIVWTNDSGGAWNVASHWSPNQVPASADLAVITNAGNYTVNITTAATIGGLNLGGASGTQSLSVASVTLTLNGPAVVNARGVLNLDSGGVTPVSPLTVNGVMNWNGGNVNGTLTVASNGLLRLSSGGFKTMVGASLTNAGTIIYTGVGSWALASAFIYNLPGALFDLQSDGNMYHWYGNAPVFQNAGVLRKSAGTSASTFGAVALNNSATVEVLVGSINFGGNSTFDGQFNVAAGAGLQFSAGGTITGTINAVEGATVTFSGGNFGIIPGSSLTGAGAYRFTGGQLTLEGVSKAASSHRRWMRTHQASAFSDWPQSMSRPRSSKF